MMLPFYFAEVNLEECTPEGDRGRPESPRAMRCNTWHAIEAEGDYCAERDVSGCRTISYCLDNEDELSNAA